MQLNEIEATRRALISEPRTGRFYLKADGSYGITSPCTYVLGGVPYTQSTSYVDGFLSLWAAGHLNGLSLN